MTAIITMTAGAHSSQPSLRSARAPSDSCGLRLAGASAGAPVVTVWVLVLIGPFLSSRPGRCLRRGGSRDQALRLQGVVDLAAIAFSVLTGLILTGGEVRCEMSMDTTW